jgi:hypothetical protein
LADIDAMEVAGIAGATKLWGPIQALPALDCTKSGRWADRGRPDDASTAQASAAQIVNRLSLSIKHRVLVGLG